MSKLKSEVSIGNLKNKLSAYLKKVKTGNELIVTEHNHPVAKIIPFESHSDELRIVPSKFSPSAIMKIAETTANGNDFQSLEGLRQDRGER